MPRVWFHRCCIQTSLFPKHYPHSIIRRTWLLLYQCARVENQARKQARTKNIAWLLQLQLRQHLWRMRTCWMSRTLRRRLIYHQRRLTLRKDCYKQWGWGSASTQKIFRIYRRRTSSRVATIWARSALLLGDSPYKVRCQQDLLNSDHDVFNAMNTRPFWDFAQKGFDMRRVRICIFIWRIV